MSSFRLHFSDNGNTFDNYIKATLKVLSLVSNEACSLLMLGDDKEITLYIIINDLWKSKLPFPLWLHHGSFPLNLEESR